MLYSICSFKLNQAQNLIIQSKTLAGVLVFILTFISKQIKSFLSVQTFFKYIYSSKQRFLVKSKNTASNIQFICFAIAAGKLNIFCPIAKKVLIYVSRIFIDTLHKSKNIFKLFTATHFKSLTNYLI